MIAGLLDTLRPRVSWADAVRKTDETVTVLLSDTSGLRVEHRSSVGWHVTASRDGREGQAGGTGENWDDLVEQVLASAHAGFPSNRLLPAPAPLPSVATGDHAAAAAGADQLLRQVRVLEGHLASRVRSLEVWGERSLGTVEAGNTRGLLVRYDQTLVGFGASVVMRGPGGPIRADWQYVGVTWPGTDAMNRLVTELETALSRPWAERRTLPRTLRVQFQPRAVRALFRPVHQALVASSFFGTGSPMGGQVGRPLLPSAVTLVDDPLAPYRPGSRPADDDGVVSRRLPLVTGGRISGWICDLATGSRLGIPSTGHARRLPFAPSRAAFTNLCLLPGDDDPAEALAEAEEALVIEDLPVPRGNVADGWVELSTPWAYLVARGEPAGRMERVTLRGNVYRMLNRLVALGREAAWHGAWSSPAVVLDDVEILVG